MNNREEQNSFSQTETVEQSAPSKAGDEHWPRSAEEVSENANTSGNVGQQETGGTGGYGGTSGASGAGEAEQ